MARVYFCGPASRREKPSQNGFSKHCRRSIFHTPIRRGTLSAWTTPPSKAATPNLINFLPANRRQKQIGERVAGKVRFGSRHNESIMVLPGIVRFLAGSTPRTTTP